jgi:hypothetical protein
VILNALVATVTRDQPSVSLDFSQVLARWSRARNWACLPDGRLLTASLNGLAVCDASLQHLTAARPACSGRRVR